MNKNFKAFKIHGLTGLILLCFIIAGLFCGFVLFPIWFITASWNELVGNIGNGPVINHYQAALLWAFIAISFYMLLKNSISIKIYKSEDPEEDNFSKIIEEENENDN